MRLFLLLIFLFFGVFPTAAQDWNWARHFGGGQTDVLGSMVIDSDGSVFMVGDYKGEVNFGATSFEALQGSDAFLSKLDDQGNAEWAVTAGSFNNDASIDVEIDNQGNVVWLGQFWIEAFFENDTILAGSNAKAYFVAKYDGAGSLIWVESITGSALKVVSDLAIDAADNIMITGYFSDSLEVGELALTAENELDAFLLKMSSEGDVLWGRRYGDSGEVYPQKIERTTDGDYVIAGELKGGITIGSDTLVSVTSDFDMFVGLVDEDGNGVWGNIGSGVFDNLLNGLVVDQESIYLSGNFVGVLGIGTEEILTPGFTDNLYLIKMDVLGDVIWARGLSADVFNDPSYSLDIAIKDDLVMMIGQFEGDLFVDNLSLNNESGVSGFIGGFDNSTGLVKQLDKIESSSQSSGLEIAVGLDDEIYVGGVFFEMVSFDDFDLLTNGGSDIFVAQTSDLFTGLFDQNFEDNKLSVFPNPTGGNLILETVDENFEIEIFDALGRRVFFGENQSMLNVEFLNPGTYFLSYRNNRVVRTTVFVKY